MTLAICQNFRDKNIELFSRKMCIVKIPILMRQSEIVVMRHHVKHYTQKSALMQFVDNAGPDQQAICTG